MYAAPRSTRQVGVFLFADGDDPDDALSTSGLVLPLPPLTVVVVDEDDDDADVVALLASSSASPPDRRGAASCSAAIVWLQPYSVIEKHGCCLGCAQPGKYLRLGIAEILPTTKSSKKIQF